MELPSDKRSDSGVSSRLAEAAPLLPDATTFTTRRQFRRRIIDLFQRNQDLETHLQITRRTCQQYEEKSAIQETRIRELESVIGRLPLTNEEDTDDVKSDKPAIYCNQLLVEKSNQIAQLTFKLDDLMLQLHRTNQQGNKDAQQILDSSNVKLQSSSQPVSCSSDSSSEHVRALEAELEEQRRKCEALERSMATLKHKTAEREVRNAKNLRFMKEQLDLVLCDRNRRIEAQRTLEEQVTKLDDENQSKDTEIVKLKAQLQQLLLSKKTASLFRGDGDIKKNSTSYNNEDGSWDEQDGSIPPILVAASRDDDTSSETDSQYDLSEEI
ncbi:hypothetical protein IV203_030256 [Nitzschia inconspicua]|uniref:Uncharacterized protein n=1 Tax=Nitzschia inconspicua TaxID=303405 RepID=A0A9K3Q215_9STRA|nr:hypothetical protein IV203_030256 [Nitzschia inconspicua]